ncbi:MAG: YtxH domain-containing protein [Candidatus Tectomicrobia bacterium]|uniref:YtxH domain-containing protein n=1 Tax=Tectimicrobiota bacterium TaxID=2528274 RepID=A0A932GMN5_UNCTE|nr:YtxH domain-containing protein [Candidatus Tectomicrobia bacterium]
MSEDKGFSSGAIGLAFLIGGLLGASVAMLLAPTSGKESRVKIKGLADEALEKGKHFVESRKEILEKAVTAGREAMEKENAALPVFF